MQRMRIVNFLKREVIFSIENNKSFKKNYKHMYLTVNLGGFSDEK